MTLQEKFLNEVEELKKKNDNVNISDFITKVLKPPFGIFRRKQIIEMIPLFLEHTKRDNFNWVAHPKFQDDIEFMTVLSEEVKRIPVYKKGLSYTDLLRKVPATIKFSEVYLLFLIDQGLSERDIKMIFQGLCFENSEYTRFFLETVKKGDDVICPTLWAELVHICEITRNSEVLNENIDLFLEKTNNYKSLSDSGLLSKKNKEKVSQYIDDHIEEILGKEKIRNWYIVDLTCGEDNKHKVIDYVCEHIDLLLKDYTDKFQFVNEINSRTDLEEKGKIIKAYERYINDNLEASIARITLYSFDRGLTEEAKVQGYLSNEVLVEMLAMIFREICKNENVELKDIKYLNNGYYSRAYQIGNKIIKLGHSREIFEFPNNPYVIAPILRKKFEIENSTAKELYVEIQERVELVDDFKVSEEELYQLYKRIRELGLMWLDVDTRNAGRLIKDNVVHWNGELAQIDHVLSFEPKRGTVTLKAGELVVLDADFIFDEKSVPEKYLKGNWGYMEKQRRFEERYQKELAEQYHNSEEGKKNGL